MRAYSGRRVVLTETSTGCRCTGQSESGLRPTRIIVPIIIQKAVEVQIKVKQNDEQVAVVYFTMVRRRP